MMPTLGLTDIQMGQVFSAFVLGYALFQIPGGWLGDRWGPRNVLALAVLWWSIFTAATALAPTFWITEFLGILGSLILVRFLIGVGEAAALPNFNRTVANWHPPRERGFGMGLTIGGIGIGSALTPPVTAWIMVNYGWQTAFYVAGLLGIGIAILWWWYATDHPQDHPHINKAELQLITGAPSPQETPSVAASASQTGKSAEVKGQYQTIPWKALFHTPTVWWLILSYTCLGYVAYIYMSWFYLYLVNIRGFGELQGAWYASAPFVAMTAFCPLGGWVTDRMTHSYGVNIGRASIGVIGMTLAALCIVIGANAQSSLLAMSFLSIGAGWLYFTVGAFWASTMDLSQPHAGTVSGMMNTGANLGGTLSPTLTPWLADQFGWSIALGFAAGIAALGGVLWLWIRPGDGLHQR